MSFTGKTTSKRVWAIVAVLVLVGSGFLAMRTRGAPAAKAADPVLDLVVAPGRVEPVSEEIQISFDLNGTVRRLPVEEGDHVHRGQVLAELANDDYRARQVSAEAQLRLKEAELRRVLNGARQQERREAQAAVHEAEAVVHNAELEVERSRALYAHGTVARLDLDRAERDYGVAVARLDAAREHFAVIDDFAREEDRSRAEADVALARGQLEEARALFTKTILRSPVDGVVLRKHLRVGESVSQLSPVPVLTLADNSVLRVRAEVDEADVARIRVGQRVWVTAQAYGDKRFVGRVVRVGKVLGKKQVHTDDPAERADTKILETLVELAPDEQLPLGLRVDTFIVVGGPSQ